MAKIPLGNFGLQVADVGRTPTAGPEINGGINQAVQRVASTGLQIADQQFEDQKQQQARTDQLQTITANASMQNGLADQFDALHADVMSGKVDSVEALARWKDASTGVVSDSTANLSPKVTPFVQAQGKNLQAQFNNKLMDSLRLRQSQDTAATISSTTEQLQRFAAVDPDSAIKQHTLMLDSQGGNAGYTPAQIAQQKQKFSEGVYYTQANSQANAAYQSGSIDALEQQRQRLNGPEGERLDPNQRNQLDLKIFGWQQGLQAKATAADAKAEREQLKRENVAVTSFNTSAGIVESGSLLSKDAINDLVQTTAGTEMEPRTRLLLQEQNTSARFANKSLPAQGAELEQMRAQAVDPTRGVDAQDVRTLKAREQVNANLVRQVNEGDAWQAAQKAGVVPNAPVLNLQSPADVVSTLQQRMGSIGDVEAWAGKPVSPFQLQEAQAFQKVLSKLPPDQAATLLGTMGDTIGNIDRVGALASQIKDKDSTMAMAMMYANSKTTMGRNTAELVLRGDQALKDKTIAVDSAKVTGWRADISKQIRGAYSNQQAEDSIVNAAYRIAAATDGDVDRAVRLATGGIVEHNGGKVPLPYGWSEDRFDKGLAAIQPANLQSQTPDGQVVIGNNKMPLADFVKTLPDARLVHAGQGVYNVRAGNTLVTNTRGQRINIQVGP